MVDRERKTIHTPMESLNIQYETLMSACYILQRLVHKYGPDAIIDIFQYPYSENQVLYVYAKRLETDEEMVRRIAQEEHRENSNKFDSE